MVALVQTIERFIHPRTLSRADCCRTRTDSGYTASRTSCTGATHIAPTELP
jgi:hypothetical protein